MIFSPAAAEDTIALGDRIGRAATPGMIIALRGGLAAGKTTLTMGIAKGLGIDDPVLSPTYTLIREYQGRLPLYHMDAYRLTGPEDFLSLGVEEYLFGDGVCVIEWSERVEAALPERRERIALTLAEDGSRRIEIQSPILEAALS